MGGGWGKERVPAAQTTRCTNVVRQVSVSALLGEHGGGSATVQVGCCQAQPRALVAKRPLPSAGGSFPPFAHTLPHTRDPRVARRALCALQALSRGHARVASACECESGRGLARSALTAVRAANRGCRVHTRRRPSHSALALGQCPSPQPVPSPSASVLALRRDPAFFNPPVPPPPPPCRLRPLTVAPGSRWPAPTRAQPCAHPQLPSES